MVPQDSGDENGTSKGKKTTERLKNIEYNKFLNEPYMKNPGAAVDKDWSRGM